MGCSYFNNPDMWHKWLNYYIFTTLSVALIFVGNCLEIKENDKVILSLTINAQPIIGQNITFSCLIFNQSEWQASWSKNSDSPLTSCTSRYCTADRTFGGKYVYSTNGSGIFMSLNFLTNQDVGSWRCRLSREKYLVFKLEEEDMVYPPSSCALVPREKSFQCFSPCIKANENFTMMWRFQSENSKVEGLTTEQSDCGHHTASKYNATFQNYTGIIKTNHGGPFTGEGQLTCTCGIEGYPTTFIESSSMEAYFYDCSIGSCIAISMSCFLLLIVISNGYIYYKTVEKEGCLQFIKQWRCIILINCVVILLISTVVITVCHVGCTNGTWIVTIYAVLVSFVYLIVCCTWFKLRLKETRNAYCSKITCTTEDNADGVTKEMEEVHTSPAEEDKASTSMLKSTYIEEKAEKPKQNGEISPMVEGDE